jgi:hypothetical protein
MKNLAAGLSPDSVGPPLHRELDRGLEMLVAVAKTQDGRWKHRHKLRARDQPAAQMELKAL